LVAACHVHVTHSSPLGASRRGWGDLRQCQAALDAGEGRRWPLGLLTPTLFPHCGSHPRPVPMLRGQLTPWGPTPVPPRVPRAGLGMKLRGCPAFQAEGKVEGRTQLKRAGEGAWSRLEQVQGGAGEATRQGAWGSREDFWRNVTRESDLLLIQQHPSSLLPRPHSPSLAFCCCYHAWGLGYSAGWRHWAPAAGVRVEKDRVCEMRSGKLRDLSSWRRVLRPWSRGSWASELQLGCVSTGQGAGGPTPSSSSALGS
jgi:hypothetical protein